MKRNYPIFCFWGWFHFPGVSFDENVANASEMLFKLNKLCETGFAGLTIEESDIIKKEARRKKQRQYAALGRNAPPFNTHLFPGPLFSFLFIVFYGVVSHHRCALPYQNETILRVWPTLNNVRPTWWCRSQAEYKRRVVANNRIERQYQKRLRMEDQAAHEHPSVGTDTCPASPPHIVQHRAVFTMVPTIAI